MSNVIEAPVGVHPSPAARSLFGQMVARADQELHLPLAQCLAISVCRARCGADPKAYTEINELLVADWIGPASDGGWLLR